MKQNDETDRIMFRLGALEAGYSVLSRMRGWENCGVYLNIDILYHAVDSYFQDIERMKDYRRIEHLDRHKQAAFTMKWIAQLRPVQIDKDFFGQAEISMTASLLLANETFAIHAGLGYMDINIQSLSDKYFRNLLYLLHFHTLGCEQLASEMFLLEQYHKWRQNEM